MAGGAAIAALLGAQAAEAAGYAVREQSAVAQGNSQAGAAARGDDPSMMHFNPAALGWLDGTQVVAIGSGIFPSPEARSGSANRAAVLGGSVIGGSLGGDAGVDAFVPAFYASTALSDQWRLGLAVTSPWGLVTKYPEDYIGRYHALTSSLRTINIAPTLAWRPLPNLSIGVGLQIQYATARLSNAVDFGSVGALNPALFAAGFRPGRFDGRATISGDSADIGWQIGAQWEPVSGTRLGLSFRSAIFQRLEGDASFEGVPEPLARSPNFQNTGATAKLTTPEVLNLGVTQRIDARWTVMAGAEWTNWSRFRDLTIDFANGRAPSVTEERWRDSVFLSAGAEYRATETVTLRTGFAWDQSPVPNSTRTPRIPDSDRYWLSVGATWQALPNLALTAAYTHVFVNDTTVDLRDRGPSDSNFLRGDLRANYRASVDIVALQARLTF
jgi:long-chain fatty acid transport protein